MSQSNFDLVGEFHKVFNHLVNNTLQLDIFEKDPCLVKLRYDLIKEEFDELNESLKNKNLVETVDAICDILYVVYGASHVFGFKYDEGFAFIHGNRLGKTVNELKNSEIVKLCMTNKNQFISNVINKDLVNLDNEYTNKNFNALKDQVDLLLEHINTSRFLF